jgi:hypothetical protein
MVESAVLITERILKENEEKWLFIQFI